MSASAPKMTGTFGCSPQVAETQIESKLLKKRALLWRVMDSDGNKDTSGWDSMVSTPNASKVAGE